MLAPGLKRRYLASGWKATGTWKTVKLPPQWQSGAYLEDHQLTLEDGKEVGGLTAHGHMHLHQGSLVHEVQLLSIADQGLALICHGLVALWELRSDGLKQLTVSFILRSQLLGFKVCTRCLRSMHLPQVQDVLDTTQLLVRVEDKVATSRAQLAMMLGVHRLPG